MRSLARLLLSALLVLPAVSHADWLGLSDGTWDVTLTCAATAVPCPSSFHAALTVSGGGATALGTAFNGQTFSGDPDDEVQTVAGFTSERSFVTLDPFSFFFLAKDVDGHNPLGLTDRWWDYCRNASATSCTPAAQGNWTATLVTPVPEPSSWALMAAGLAGLGALRRRRAASSATRAARRS